MVKKKSKAEIADRLNPELERSMEEFAEVITDSLKDEHQTDLEPFETYAQKVRSHIYENVNEFRSRFGHGYLLILEEIENEQQTPKDKNVIKP